MAEINLLKTDNRGRVTLPTPFRKEPLFEYMIEGDQITLYPVRTVRKFPDLSNLPEEELSPQWLKKEHRVNKDRRQGVVAAHPAEALKKLNDPRQSRGFTCWIITTDQQNRDLSPWCLQGERPSNPA